METDTPEIDPNIRSQAHPGHTETETHPSLRETMILKLPDTEAEKLLLSLLIPLIPERNLTLMATSTLETDPSIRSLVHLGHSETETHPSLRETMILKLLATVVELLSPSPLTQLTLERNLTLTAMFTLETDPNTKSLVHHGHTEMETHLSSRPPLRTTV